MRTERRAWIRSARTGAVCLAVCALSLQLGGLSTAAPSSGSSGSSGNLGSVEGTVSSGSTIPGPLQEDPGPKPELRDDIVVPAIVGEKVTAPQAVRLTVASPALRREVGVEILLPADNSVPRPALYMLEGVDAGEKSSGWMTIGGAPAFFADKNVNVVMLNGGIASLYSDWESPDPRLGLHKWETFITEELPPLINARLKTNGINAIAGNSMGAMGAMMLAQRFPDMYRGVAVFSGCYSTMDPLGRTAVQATISSRSGDPANIWGVPGGPEWEAHDSLINAEKLRGKEIYVSTANGRPGSDETLQTPELLERLVIGGGIEVAAHACTKMFDARLQELKIPAQVDYEPNGTHAWAYWRERLPKAWPTLSRALGV
ncbi:MAG: esterase family protein [Rhodococcus sp.]|nr:esterase family protein [Rhodococcus sp. (in: high G+C Gram-positive bacteria)]